VSPELEFLPRPERFDGPVRWFVLHRKQLLITSDPSLPLLPEWSASMAAMLFPGESHYLGRLRGQHCCAVVMADDIDAPEGFLAEDLRRLIHRLEQQEFAMASRALQLLGWRNNHRFCSRCGTPTQLHLRDHAMVCPACEYTQYPRITPCVIMLVTRGEKALLAQGGRFPAGFYSCLAGFMEPGEDAEHAVRREVWEETRLQVGKLRYHGSQSWPFPHSLMLAFHAEYEGGEIEVDGEEILAADWFSRDSLPQIPPPGSIARSLIESWLQGCRA